MAPKPFRAGSLRAAAGTPAAATTAASRNAAPPARAAPRVPSRGRRSSTQAGRGRPGGRSAATAEQSAAVVVLQARWRGVLARQQLTRYRWELDRAAQMREEEEEERSVAARRQAAAAAKAAAEEEARMAEAARREAELRALRGRRCTAEQMLQGLPSERDAWEENADELLDLMEQPPGPSYARWLGTHETKKSARWHYLQLARRWHPDKWAMQGVHCVALATEVTKCLVCAYDRAMKDLPADRGLVSCEDEDEEREVCEFASWIGISFKGMHEVWKERKGVTGGQRK